MFHRHQVVVGGDAGLAGGVDDDVDLGGGDQRFGRGDGDLAGCRWRRALGERVGFDRMPVVAIGDGHGLAGGMGRRVAMAQTSTPRINMP